MRVEERRAHSLIWRKRTHGARAEFLDLTVLRPHNRAYANPGY
jgi:hypothetical protein